MQKWLTVGLARETLRRSLKVALLVGTILVAINHGDALLAGEIDIERVVKIIFTYCVPYLVSTYASVSAQSDSA